MWDKNLLQALMMMGEQLSAVAMQQTQIVGSFFDAENQMKNQKLLQTIDAQAHKDYHPSTGLCDFGSFGKSLAASERKNEIGTFALSQIKQDRALLHQNSVGQRSDSSDGAGRLDIYKNAFCDPADNDTGLRLLCGAGGTDDERLNKDIDFARTFSWPWTFNVDLTNETPATPHEEELIALGYNLYGRNLFTAVPASDLRQSGDESKLEAAQERFLNMRALNAKRSVAENSFNAIMTMKAEGTPGSKDYLIGMLSELGIKDDAEKLILSGGAKNPSYYAQMEIMSKKAFMNPDFYTDLYDTPVNVERKVVAMQAVDVMQKFDLLKSHLRTEAILSVMLENQVEKLQDEVETQIAGQTSGSAVRE